MASPRHQSTGWFYKSAAGILIGDSERSDRASPFGNSQIGQKIVILEIILRDFWGAI
jgi:hypothetical protein